MRPTYLKVALAVVASAPLLAQAQSSSPPLPDTVAQVAAKPAPTKNTLFKLGTGITRGLGFNFGKHWVAIVPVVLGIERHLSPALSVYGNLSTGLQLARRRDYSYNSSLLIDPGVDAGVRYYYNQEKRKLKGRATGPFVGNYLALHSSTAFYSYQRPNSYNDRLHISYEYTSLNLIWGMQRRVGRHGLFDGYVGAGVANRFSNRYFSNDQFGPNIESGVKLSLVP